MLKIDHLKSLTQKMNTNMSKITISLLSILLLTSQSTQGNSIKSQKPEDFIRIYIELEHKFDPRIAELYLDNALIQNKRTYPTGKVRVMKVDAKDYKKMIVQSIPILMLKNDTSEYSDIRYSKEGDAVRVIATRFSNLKKYSSPISWLLVKNENGDWRISEELSESRP